MSSYNVHGVRYNTYEDILLRRKQNRVESRNGAQLSRLPRQKREPRSFVVTAASTESPFSIFFPPLFFSLSISLSLPPFERSRKDTRPLKGRKPSQKKQLREHSRQCSQEPPSALRIMESSREKRNRFSFAVCLVRFINYVFVSLPKENTEWIVAGIIEINISI